VGAAVIWGFDPRGVGDEVLAQVYRLRRDANAEVAPDEPFDPEADAVSLLRHRPDGHRAWHWAAGAATTGRGEPALTPALPASGGAALTGYAELTTGTGSGTGFARIVVAAPHRRRGLGRALLTEVSRRARAVGCTVLNGTFGGPAGGGFCAAVGARTGLAYVRCALHLPGAVLTARPVPGYRLRCWHGRAPAGLLHSYAHARGAIRDAPVDDGVVLPAWTPRRIRDEENALAAHGRSCYVTVALAPHGEVAAFTEVRVPPRPSATASTQDTAVLPAHRGRGLALWVKAESLRLLAAARPDVTRVTATNAESNAAMLAVNRRLGFRATSVWRGAVLPL
jgi:GNAT superfamily N-acetyltransferase